MSHLKPETKDIQSRLASYCVGQESPENIPGIRTDRVGHYKRLIHNIIEDSLSSAYPIAADDLGEETWQTLVDSFIREAKPSNPQLWKMPYDLIDFAENSNLIEQLDRPYFLDLLKFEWIEIEVHTMPDKVFNSHKPFSDNLNCKIVVNPHFEHLALSYPVYKLKGKALNDQKGQYHIIVFRDEEYGVVEFLELSPFLIHFLFHCQENILATEALDISLNAFGVERSDVIENQAISFIQNMISKGLIFGELK